MDKFLQICGICILAALLAFLMKRTSSALGMVLSIACCVLAVFLALQILKPILDFLHALERTAQLQDTLFQPLLKTVAIGFLTQLTMAICQDAGQQAMAKAVELCGSLVALYLSLPLLTAVLNLLRQLTGG